MPTITFEPYGGDLRVFADDLMIGMLKKRLATGCFEPSDALVKLGVEPGSEWRSPKSAAYSIAHALA